MPVLRIGVGLEPIAANIEPDRRVEGDLLVKQQMGKLGVEGLGIMRGGKVSALNPQSRMDSATRVIRARTPDSRSVVPFSPWRYFEATMLVAVMTSRRALDVLLLEMVLPLKSWITASRSSQTISS